ncbi:MAG: hypothetical protein KDD82_24660, partial [Planctomycetes bacterium]|nr:hypothetical protein [Planctomycetota bacterium]
GVGARALAEQKGRAETPCTVRRRRGPVALVEFADEERRWLPVFRLGLVGPGVHPGEQGNAEVVLCPWPSNDHLYVGVVVERDEDSGLARVAHLDGDMLWVAGKELQPLPGPAEFVRYSLPDGSRVPAALIRYPAPWLAEVGRRDNRTHVFVHLDQLRVYPEDRD